MAVPLLLLERKADNSQTRAKAEVGFYAGSFESFMSITTPVDYHPSKPTQQLFLVVETCNNILRVPQISFANGSIALARK